MANLKLNIKKKDISGPSGISSKKIDIKIDKNKPAIERNDNQISIQPQNEKIYQKDEKINQESIQPENNNIPMQPSNMPETNINECNILCSSCGSKLTNKEKFCNNCGAKINWEGIIRQYQPEPQPKQETPTTLPDSVPSVPIPEPELQSIKQEEQLLINKKDKPKKEKITNKKIKNNKLQTQDDIDSSIKKRRQAFLIKKSIFITLVVLFEAALIIFGVKAFFFSKERSIREIGIGVNQFNFETRFPFYGVEGYISRNAKTLLDKCITLDRGIRDYTVKNINIRRINKIDDITAKVVFSANIDTTNGSFMYDFSTVLNYDFEKKQYSTTNNIALIPNLIYDNIENTISNIYAFNKEDLLNDKVQASAKLFMTNFFTIVYNERKDYSQMYTGTNQLGQQGVKFEEIKELYIYGKDNIRGANCYMEVILSLPAGVKYKTPYYAKLTPNGETWKIERIE